MTNSLRATDVCKAGELPEDYWQAAPFEANVGLKERLVSSGIGFGLLRFGLRRGAITGGLAALAGGALLYRGLTGHCAVYRALGHDARHKHSAIGVRAQQGVHFETSLVVNRPAREIYDFWRNLSNLPRILDHLESVTALEQDSLSHWIARGPWDIRIEWDAEIINDNPGEMLAWRSVFGSELDTAGSVHFIKLSHDRGTAVRVVLKYDPPGSRAGAILGAWLGRDVESEMFEGMRRMKRILETGCVPTTAGQPQGQCNRPNRVGVQL